MKISILTGILLGFSQTAMALPITVYEQAFESDFMGLSEANLTRETAEDGTSLTFYHGEFFFGDTTTLNVDLTGIEHEKLALEFDLYLFGSWDGISASGPDGFTLSGDINFDETFTNHAPEGDSYPGDATETYGTGTLATHVYRRLGASSDNSEFLIDHIADSFTVTFGGTNLSDEWWGIDNIRLSVNSPTTVVPLPAGFGLLGAALLAVFSLRQRREKS